LQDKEGLDGISQAAIDADILTYVSSERPGRFTKWQKYWFANGTRQAEPLRPQAVPLATAFPQTASVSIPPTDASLDRSRSAIFAGNANVNNNSSNGIHAADLFKAMEMQKVPSQIKVVRSLCSPQLLVTLPDSYGYMIVLYVSMLAELYFERSTNPERTRFHQFTSLPHKDFLNLVTFNFVSIANPEGFNILSLTSDKGSATSFLDVACEMSRFLNAFFNLADPSVGHFAPLIDSFLGLMSMTHLDWRSLKFIYASLSYSLHYSKEPVRSLALISFIV
jgi:hypothetical protein